MKHQEHRPPFSGLSGRNPGELFAQIPTPAYVLDEAQLIRNGEILAGVAERTGAKILLAQKAFSNYDLYPVLEPYLAGTEASGLYEARLGCEKMPGKETHVFCAAYRENEFREKKPLGVLFLGGTHRNFREDFDKIQVPAVLVTGSARNLGFGNLSSVCADDCEGAVCAVEHLLRSGHRQLLVLGGDLNKSDTSRNRYNGCVEAFRRSGLEFDGNCYYTCRYSYQSGYEAMKQAMGITEVKSIQA